MAQSSLVQRCAGQALRLAAALSFIAPLATRLVVGQSFVLTGRGKIANFENTVGFFTSLGIPMPELNAAVVSRMELWGGWALLLGLATRFAALGLASTMAVALATAHKSETAAALGDFVPALLGGGAPDTPGLTDILPVPYLLFLAWLALKGPGALSLDALLARWLKVGAAAEGACPAIRVTAD